MTPATITPIPGGRAAFSWRGVEHTFDDVFAARAEAEARGIPCEVAPFPMPPIVLAESPALRKPR